MGEGHLEKTLKNIRISLLLWFGCGGFLLIGGWWLAEQYLNLEPLMLLGGLLAGWIIVSIIFAFLAARSVNSPLKALSEAILHISPTPIPVKSPNIDRLRIGRELVATLVRQVYELNTGSQQASAIANSANMSLQQLPVAVITIDKEANITFANVKAVELAGGGSQDLVGKNLYGLFDIFFMTEETLQAWIEDVRRRSATAQKIWHEVRINTYGDKVKYVDLAASFINQASEGSEVMLALFDETNVYADKDNALSFVALAVHELRTPLTILRGYIEVLEEEVKQEQNASAERQALISKMRVSAENLTAFVGNILNVARIDQNQLDLKLLKENWESVLTDITGDMRLRGEVYGKTIEVNIAKNLPPVGIDRISIAEIMTNLLDNAIKYSPPDKTLIKVNSTLNKDGLIETTVQDFGVGIPESVLPHLFEKYARNPRNRGSIGGTGLGLYLCKALVAAHGGNIWVRSKEGQGSTFGFTVLPYDKVIKGAGGDSGNITRHAHGWIKNHSLSRG